MGLILLIVPPFAVEVNAMKLLPPLDWHAPRTKSIWPPEPAHVLCADGFSTDLAEEIDLDGCVYGYHVIVLADDLGIVHIVNGQDLDRRVIIDIVVYPLGAVSKGGNALAAVDLLFGVVDGAALDKLDHGVGEHFGMYAEIVLGFERHTGSIGDCADAELDACTVGDLLC